LSMNQKKSFSLPPFFAAFVNMLFCHRIVNNFFGNLQKTFCEGFLKPRCFMRRGRLLRSSLMPVNSFSPFFPEIFFQEPSEKGCFQAANAMSTLPGQECQSFPKIFSKSTVFLFAFLQPHGIFQSDFSLLLRCFPSFCPMLKHIAPSFH